MRYGFVIDQDRCIGCHACTVACKEEHQVPVGVFRTWVKYIEKGEFPFTSRHFGVLRCNHCDQAPCIEICPTRALYRRDDGIVDFDNRRCIGCKGCMQACPYDALYIDPQTQTAAKCNFCAHRVEANLAPACVIVCPTQAIIAGDLDDPSSNVSRIVATKKVAVRKPQKGTEPKLFYVGIEGDLLQPTRLSRQNGDFWSDRRDGGATSPANAHGGADPYDFSMTREIYDVSHPAPWGWKIATYLWSKSIAAGVLLVAALLLALGKAGGGTILDVAGPIIALAALGGTLFLLVWDLKRPDRFHYLLIKPNFSSWLVLGAYVLMGYGALGLIWLVLGATGHPIPGVLVGFTAAFGIASACYSAFLFAQAKGRDLWQSPLFLWHLLAAAVLAGSATMVLAATFSGAREVTRGSSMILLISAAVSLAMVLAELALPHVSMDVALATRALVRGNLRGQFWGLAIVLGLVCPIVLLAFALSPGGGGGLAVVAAALALAGLWFFERLWVKAGQSVPLS